MPRVHRSGMSSDERAAYKAEMKRTRKQCLFHRPVEHIDLSRTRTVGELVHAFGEGSFQSRNLGECARIFLKMVEDPEAVIYLGLAGALIAGGMRRVICDLLRHNLADVVVSTGANIYHDIFEARGHRHYRYVPGADDYDLEIMDVDRVYDTLVDDDLFAQLAYDLADEFIPALEERPYSSREFLERLGLAFEDEECFVAAAARLGKPLFSPSIVDSGLGMALARHGQKRPGSSFRLDLVRDNLEFARLHLATHATGGIYLGGGVPKNYIQSAQPLLEVMGHAIHAHKYAIQLTTDDPKWGGLSGCTLKESVSWGKYEHEGALGTAYVDVTIGLPLIAAYVLEHRGAVEARKPRRFRWDEEGCVRLEIG
ncbi:MAG: deoxyhypusine synthase family protein [Nitrospinota bacterium]